jgi:thymidylate synthase (FAD)
MHMNVLDKGYVKIFNHMGDDMMVVNAARVSFLARSGWLYHPPHSGEHYGWIDDNVAASIENGYLTLKKGDVSLINFCARNGHWSPFSHPQVSLELKLPGMVLEQLMKHRIGISNHDDEAYQAYQNSADNQLSMRYKEPEDFYIPDAHMWRGIPDNKKQGSKGLVGRALGDFNTVSLGFHIESSLYRYKKALEDGVAPEQARLFIPYYAMYTNRIWTSSLYGIINFLKLRLEDDAQYEIREYAKAIREIVRPLFPYSFDAFGISSGDD